MAFRAGQLTIEGEIHLLLDGVHAAICRRMVVQDYVTVPASCQIDIIAQTVSRNPKATSGLQGSSSIAESGEVGHGPQVARTLVLNCLTGVPVRVMNVLHYPQLESRAVVCTLELVNVLTAPVEGTRRTHDRSFKTELLPAVDDEVRLSEKQTLARMTSEYADVFSTGEYDHGCTVLVTLFTQALHQRLPADKAAPEEASANARRGNSRANIGHVTARFDRASR